MILMTTENSQSRLQFHFTTILHKKRKTRADSVVRNAPTEFQIGFPGCSFMATFTNVVFPFFDTTNFGASELIKRTEKLHAMVHFAYVEIAEQSLSRASAHGATSNFCAALRAHDVLMAVPRYESRAERNPIANDASFHLRFRIGEEFVAQTEERFV